MIRYTQGNLLEADTEALINTVNTVGVMGKGIALMFKERFPKNMAEYAKACKNHELQTGKLLVTDTGELMGPRWIINFPTKQHWRSPSKMEWIVEGLQDLRNFLLEYQVKSVAIPPLGAGNGGLNWPAVREQIELALHDLPDVDIVVYEPTAQYQNVAKRTGVEKLTPARALIAELVRRYWVLGVECTLLEIQKLAWFLERAIEKNVPDNNPLDLRFKADLFGPYAPRLNHLLDNLDGSYLRAEKRIKDASREDVIWFDEGHRDLLQAYLKTEEITPFLPALEQTVNLIDGFESPFGMELLATVDWLVCRQQVEPSVAAIRNGLAHWPATPEAAKRKFNIFDDRVVGIALNRLENTHFLSPS